MPIGVIMKNILPQNSLGDPSCAPWELGNKYFSVCSAILSKALWPSIRQCDGTNRIIQIFLLCLKLNFKLFHNENYAFPVSNPPIELLQIKCDQQKITYLLFSYQHDKSNMYLLITQLGYVYIPSFSANCIIFFIGCV